MVEVIYVIVVVGMICMLLGYIYMGMIGMEGVYCVMCDGYVDEVWVKEYYELWYDDVKVGKIFV